MQFIYSLEGQHHCLESDAGRNRKPEEVMDKGGQMGEFGTIVNEESCSVPDMLDTSCKSNTRHTI